MYNTYQHSNAIKTQILYSDKITKNLAVNKQFFGAFFVNLLNNLKRFQNFDCYKKCVCDVRLSDDDTSLLFSHQKLTEL